MKRLGPLLLLMVSPGLVAAALGATQGDARREARNTPFTLTPISAVLSVPNTEYTVTFRESGLKEDDELLPEDPPTPLVEPTVKWGHTPPADDPGCTVFSAASAAVVNGSWVFKATWAHPEGPPPYCKHLGTEHGGTVTFNLEIFGFVCDAEVIGTNTKTGGQPVCVDNCEGAFSRLRAARDRLNELRRVRLLAIIELERAERLLTQMEAALKKLVVVRGSARIAVNLALADARVARRLVDKAAAKLADAERRLLAAARAEMEAEDAYQRCRGSVGLRSLASTRGTQAAAAICNREVAAAAGADAALGVLRDVRAGIPKAPLLGAQRSLSTTATRLQRAAAALRGTQAAQLRGAALKAKAAAAAVGALGALKRLEAEIRKVAARKADADKSLAACRATP